MILFYFRRKFPSKTPNVAHVCCAEDNSCGSCEASQLCPAVNEERKVVDLDLESLVLGEVIGRGRFGVVYKGRCKVKEEDEETRVDVAVKTFNR